MVLPRQFGCAFQNAANGSTIPTVNLSALRMLVDGKQ